MVFLSKDEVLSLFNKFEIIQFEEIEKDSLTGLGEMKHWHIFDIIAKKNKKEDKNMKRETYEYIGKKVKAKIDRPLNSEHPKHGFKYLVNYGYIPGTISGDGEELDCYILGVDIPLEEFEGDCIAVIHRTNDDDDKLIIVPEGKQFTDDEIRKLTNFQEQYFESEIIR